MGEDEGNMGHPEEFGDLEMDAMANAILQLGPNIVVDPERRKTYEQDVFGLEFLSPTFAQQSPENQAASRNYLMLALMVIETNPHLQAMNTAEGKTSLIRLHARKELLKARDAAEARIAPQNNLSQQIN